MMLRLFPKSTTRLSILSIPKNILPVEAKRAATAKAVKCVRSGTQPGPCAGRLFGADAALLCQQQ